MMVRRHPSLCTRCVLILWILSGTEGIAQTIYQCRSASGKPAFVANPTGFADCRPFELKVDQPNPEDVARALEHKRRREEEDRQREARAREERLTRAREAEAEAALRRARAAEEELRLLKQRQAAERSHDDKLFLWPYFPKLHPPPYEPRLPRQNHAVESGNRLEAGISIRRRPR